MELDYWQKQTTDTPLFENILWSRPEYKAGAGKLLIIGGNAAGFAAVGEAHAAAMKAGAGTIRTLLPDVLRKTVGVMMPDCEFAPSTPSGSFAKEALSEWLTHAQWADVVLLAGDFGRNSETAILLESFLQKYSGLVCITRDAVDYLYHAPELALDREHTTLCLSMAQLQKLGIASKHTTPFLLSMGMVLLVQALHEFTSKHSAHIITKELASIVVASNGQVSSTKLREDKEMWRVSTAAAASVLWMQNATKPFEALTTSLIV